MKALLPLAGLLLASIAHADEPTISDVLRAINRNAEEIRAELDRAEDERADHERRITRLENQVFKPVIPEPEYQWVWYWEPTGETVWTWTAWGWRLKNVLHKVAYREQIK